MKISIPLVVLLSSVLITPVWSDNGSGGSGDPKPVPHHIQHLIDTGNYQKAKKKLRYFVRGEKSSFNGWRLLAISQLKTGQLEASLKSHRKALNLNSTHIGTIRSLGELYVALGDEKEAENQLNRLEYLCGTCEDYLALNLVLSSENNG
ncbi:MAG: tetratricopeptide repeat protein [Acidiferrobacterales bacterium]|nr:tetratricopeptide repeat protein [Acidiferrobacterales bacterium]